MDKAIKSRKVCRGSFTRHYNAIIKLLDEKKLQDARAMHNMLMTDWEKLRVKDEDILDMMLQDGSPATDEDLERERESADEYQFMYESISITMQDIGNGHKPVPSIHEDDSSQVSGDSTTKHLRLPPLNIGTFNGDLKNWLSFWGQFEPIHEDETIPTFHKFRILVQSMKEGTRARQVVESFPPSKDKTSYDAAVSALKERFGREDLLIEVYVRELLSIIIQNSKSSVFSLIDMYDTLECQLRFLETLGVTTGKCAAILCPLLESCMPEDFLRVWQRSHIPEEIGDAESRLGKFREFIKGEVQNEQRISLAMNKFGMKSDMDSKKLRRECNKQDVPTASTLLTTHQSSKRHTYKCIFCDQSHESADCIKARDMPSEDKLRRVREEKVCYLCLKPSHSSKICRKPSCPLCDRKHIIILCPNYERFKGTSITKSKNVTDEAATSDRMKAVNVASHTSLTYDASVLLPTLRVKLRSRRGEDLVIRAVFDTAAQRSYILNSTAERIRCSSEGQETLFHSLFGGQKTGMSRHNKYSLQLSKLSDDRVYTIEVLGQDVICGNLPTVSYGPWIQEMAEYGLDTAELLSDTGPIELLIGADFAGSLCTGNLRKFSSGTMVGIETVLGWTISGKLPIGAVKTTLGMLTTTLLVEEMRVSDLWKLEILGIEDPIMKKTDLELQVKITRDFVRTLKINSEGRYEVNLPWKEEHSPLPNNFDVALKRLDVTYKKLEKDGYLQEYNEVFEQWVNEGVIEEVPISELEEGSHYLPHRHIVKPNSTTKIRPVFDASAHEKDSPCLNQCLEKGCNLIEQIPPLLNGFRMHKIGVVADIRRAFLQISVCPADRNVLLFLWKNDKGELIVYRHKRVVFGLTCSPFLLGAVIRSHLEQILETRIANNSQISPSTIKTLLKCFYVDNAITSFDHHHELDRFINEATSIMSDGKFDLRGWEYSDFQCTEKPPTPVLGLLWDRKTDTLSISPDSLKISVGKVTKRVIMSAAHKVFDPLGFASPVTLCPKLLIKELWESKIGWDEDVPLHIESKFLKWVNELEQLINLKIPRWLPRMSNADNWSLHTFCDASELSYAAVIFLRVENKDGVNLQLVQSKTRVAQNMTVPRKELLAANIGARLLTSVRDSFNSNCEEYFWTDSSTVLAWLRREENWVPYVRRRVEEIRKLSNVDQWYHVPGTLNPADLPSRGCMGKTLMDSKWWEGPEWLHQPKSQWPSPTCEYNEESINKERRKTDVTTLMIANQTPQDVHWYYKYFSQYPKLIRMVAWMKRFVVNCRRFGSDHFVKKRGPLSVEEIAEAEMKVLKWIQTESFSGVKDPKIAPLRPFEDHTGLIRLKTKISNRPDSEDFRFPILLPKGHEVVSRLIKHVHESNCHVGVQGLLAILRERFWTLGGRRTIKAAIADCVVCRRHEAKRMEAPTIPLPLDRVREAAAFEVVGVDLAGPIYLKGRQKAWICLFTCAVIRAVHLELLLSLSTDEFLLGLRRFVARRGRPTRVYSDQGTNFVGTSNLFQKIDWSRVLEYCELNRISWRFNPPTAAWWGGWWERLVGLVKRLLKKVLKRSTLTYTEIETVICDCESVLNSRPLTFMAEVDCEPTPITPSMFIQDVKEAALPELDVLETVDLRKSWQHRAKLKHDLRVRFRNEYLGQLQTQAKVTKQDKINIGDVVLIGHDNMKRLDWPLAIVTELLPGKDEVTRLVRLKTSSGQCLRPIQRLYRLLEGQNQFLLSDTPSSDENELPAIEDNCPDSTQTEFPTSDLRLTSKGRIVKIPQRFRD